MAFVILIIAAYLLGSVPFGLLIANAKGIDLRNTGSGNIGATNVGRALGKKWAYVCFVFDCLKGLIPMLAAGCFVEEPHTKTQLALWLTVGCATIVGHIFPIYLRFKGGKGVSTSLGMVLGLYPYFTIPGLACAVIWMLCLMIWKYVSLASIIASMTFPVILVTAIILKDAWPIAELWPLIVAAMIMPLLVLLRHVENIKRILDGSESKVFRK